MISSVPSVGIDRSKVVKQMQHEHEIHPSRASIEAMFDEPIVTDDAIKIYESSVAVAHHGAFDPTDVDRQIYEDHVALLMISVQS
jgi:hypothetical protein